MRVELLHSVKHPHLLPLSQRDCVECLLLHSRSPADNQTCQNLCKEEVITWMDTIGECARIALGSCPLLDLADA